MVPTILLLHITQLLVEHIIQRLVEIFGCNSNIPFAGLAVMFSGDFLQLPPIHARPIYSDDNDEWQILVHLWKMFKLAELTAAMRHKGDGTFIELLNKVRTASINDQDETLLNPILGGGR